ncbi:hypothetical protein BALCAV_0202930 [Alkalihalobacillus alcalophilus ATCC 27647 = CGMCC 1.3604]|uniref:N-acetyltransferase domain-containing protein n=1 Tax=Alkalihalobacillus alcalophilus ATCC 27647 = CGMCC 1.3604 TaxID=1218173 RepID=A0A094WRT3_ALKAL|nr:hypothetical protein BALCAV_0202930 [Alkalihalobacillus alcalophilus ATCC 27647 = CGMCC 1.3604]
MSTDKPELLKQKVEDMEFQMLRLQDNLKKIAQKWHILGFEQLDNEEWVIVSLLDDGNVCKIMLNTNDKAYRGTWDFSIQAQYENDFTIHIGDIKGEANKGFGSICMDYLKDHACLHNVQVIKGDIAKRDWNHLDRLIHFYKKHDFTVELNREEQSGAIACYPHS